jgi:hypothetical protein
MADWFTRRKRAIRAFQKILREKGINVDEKTAGMIYKDLLSQMPRLRAKELPTVAKFNRIEIVGMDEGGQRFVVEAGPGDVLSDVKRKKKGKGRWKQVKAFPAKQGRFILSESEDGQAISLGYVGATHKDFLILDDLYLDLFMKIFSRVSERIKILKEREKNRVRITPKEWKSYKQRVSR